jgi:hypothetical protein
MKIEIRATEERIKKYVSLDTYIAVQAKELWAIKELAALLLIDQATGDFYPATITETDEDFEVKPHPKAVKMIGRLTLDKINELVDGISAAIGETAVPPTSAESSNSSTSPE